ncbi:MAG: hypothetical protein OHK93_001806 [Ramalina farinacea]|uniref:Uncharacterized protein n=1 Tax=Ramalina farinacea TaxID=258253 RepID=A0AA43QQA0_9LECA|nr:hypothetical protein [Ramalina farinacea]
MEGIMARQGDNGRVVQDAPPSTSKSGKPSGTSSPADGQSHTPRQPKKGRKNPNKAERRNAQGAASSPVLQNNSSPGQQQAGNNIVPDDAVLVSPGASGRPKRGVGYRRGGGRGRGSARRNAAPKHPTSAQPEPRPSDDLIELMEDSPANAPGPTASSLLGSDPPSKVSNSKAHAATSGSRKQGQHRGSGRRLPTKGRQTGVTAAATAPIRPRKDPELFIPKASDIRAAGLMEDSEDESEEGEEQAVPVDGPVDEATEATEAPTAASLYRSIDKTYRETRAQRTLFTVPISAINRHNQLLHDKMRASLPSDDESLINGFEQCNMITDRLLKRVSGLDTSWAAQLQRMQHEYEDQLHAQRVVNERMHKHMQKEVERWQEKCEMLGARQAGKIKSEEVTSGRSSGSKSPGSSRAKVDYWFEGP